MNIAPLQLEAYALVDLVCRTNQEHRPDQPMDPHPEEFSVEDRVQPVPEESRLWVLALNVRLQSRPEANAPYSILLQLNGWVRALEGFDPPNLEHLVRTNGLAMLYGTAREIVRQTTAMGPFPPVLLPSVNFLPTAAPKTQPPAESRSHRLDG